MSRTRSHVRTLQITGAGVAQVTAGAGATCSFAGAGAAKATAGAGATYSITSAGAALVTASAGATYSITGDGSTRRCWSHVFDRWSRDLDCLLHDLYLRKLHSVDDKNWWLQESSQMCGCHVLDHTTHTTHFTNT